MMERPAANPPSPFRELVVTYDDGDGPPPAAVMLLDDHSRSIMSENDSPDIGFRWSVNPYRGCMHSCAYCYARPTHEYLDLGAGTDFDTKIVVKRQAPELLRAAFEKKSWTGELVMFSGVTDCYQPVEAELKLTRGCLEVCLEYRNPVSIITKGTLIERDLDLLRALQADASVQVAVSLAFADNELARKIEPWAPSPSRRFKVIETLARAGIPVGIMCAPMIPGLNDNQLVDVLTRARDAGATTAGWTLLRLPGAVATVFPERLRVALPLAADKIMNRVRDTRGGGDKVYDSRFHVRGRGTGPYAEVIAQLFATTVARLGLDDRLEDMREPVATFRRPQRGGQLSLF
jgi:DNA repair photolyase